MTTYEYLCLACEHPFEERRPMTGGQVVTALTCPACGSDRIRRRFSFSAATGSASGIAGGRKPPSRLQVAAAAVAVAAATDGSGAANAVRNGVTEAAHLGDERTTLLGFLQRQRDLVAWKMRGASDETFASVRTSTGLTLHGIVRHLENVERGWFRDFFAGETGLRYDDTDEDPDAAFRAEGVPMADLLAAYAAETALCDAVIGAAPSLDAMAADEDDPYSLRWIIMHMIEETGRHLGHIDLLREQADGAVGEEPS